VQQNQWWRLKTAAANLSKLKRNLDAKRRTTRPITVN